MKHILKCITDIAQTPHGAIFHLEARAKLEQTEGDEGLTSTPQVLATVELARALQDYVKASGKTDTLTEIVVSSQSVCVVGRVLPVEDSHTLLVCLPLANETTVIASARYGLNNTRITLSEDQRLQVVRRASAMTTLIDGVPATAAAKELTSPPPAIAKSAPAPEISNPALGRKMEMEDEYRLLSDDAVRWLKEMKHLMTNWCLPRGTSSTASIH